MQIPAAFLTPTLFGFVMVLFRCSALVAVAPVFGMKTVPPRLRMGIAMAVAFAAFAGAGAPPFAAWQRTSALLGGAIAETVLGLSAGLAARFAVDAATAAGHLVASGMGLSFGASLDPVHGTESSAIAEILSICSLAALVVAGVHREAIAWLCKSIVAIPPGAAAALDLAAFGQAIATEAIAAVGLAARMAFPVLAAVTFGHVALGVAGRTAPQLNISSVGFSVTILAGGAALYMIAPAVTEMAARAAHDALATRAL